MTHCGGNYILHNTNLHIKTYVKKTCTKQKHISTQVQEKRRKYVITILRFLVFVTSYIII